MEVKHKSISESADALANEIIKEAFGVHENNMISVRCIAQGHARLAAICCALVCTMSCGASYKHLNEEDRLKLATLIDQYLGIVREAVTDAERVNNRNL